jgi:hypothetical protein
MPGNYRIDETDIFPWKLWDMFGYRATWGGRDEKGNGNSCNMRNAFLVHKEFILTAQEYHYQ